MISHGKNIKIFSGNSHPALAMQIASALGLPLGKATISTFADGEISVSISESVRGSDVFLVQSTCGPVNNNLMELLIMIDSCKRASAGRITAVIPYFGYARQDRKSKARDPISAKLVANLITAAGADRVLTMDLHAAQIQGFFDIPVDNMLGSSVLIPYIAGKFGVGTEDTVIVSPDLGSVTRARKFTQKLDMPLAIIDKRRPKANVSEVMNIIGNVEGNSAIGGEADVIVCDGFVGNIFLKTFEGTASFLLHQLKDVFYTNTATKVGALLVKKHLGEMRKKLDPREVGGTALLGVQKPVIKAHGSSDAYAICSAAGQAIAFAESTLIQDIAANAENMAAGLEETAAE